MERVKVGVIGCGMISAIYLQNCTQMFDLLEVVAVADLVPELARQRAAEYGVPLACSAEELLANPEVEIALNLTAPTAHAEVNAAILRAGKHVYTEKPFALSREDAERVLDLAHERGLRVGCAPDTFLGAGLQTCRKLLDDGWIGAPYAAAGLILMGNAANLPRPNIQPFLQLGWDPLFDMAPYYLTALVALLGPVRRVSGAVGWASPEVTVTNPKSPQFGQTLKVEAPQHAAATLEFAAGGVASLVVAKEGFGYTPRLEIYGTEGNLQLPDPNMFSGPIRIQQPGGTSAELPFSHGFAENSRGVGLADMAAAIRSGRPHRASGALARHVLDITLAVFDSSREGRHVEIAAPVERPAPLPLGLRFGQLD